MQRLVWRNLGSLLSISGNNLFLVAVLISQGGFATVAPFVTIFVLLLLFPLCADPLSQLPAVRLHLWPLSRRDHVALRIGALLLSPALWLALLLLCSKAGWVGAMLFLAAAIAVQSLVVLAHAIGRATAINPLRSSLELPGVLGGIICIAIREITSVLDFYAAAMLSLGVVTYRVLSKNPDPEALAMCAILVALGMSTYAQRMFGLDSASGIVRYRLMPLRGWQILLAKDGAYFAILTLLVLPINLGTGLCFGLAAVAIGRYPSLRMNSPQRRWRFTSGELLWGVAQVVTGAILGIETHRIGLRFLVIAASMYLSSLVLGGRLWDRSGALARVRTPQVLGAEV
jgi:hypothetical protein